MSSEASKTWLGYPEPEDTASIKRISVDEVAELIKNQGSSEPKFQLVDVRRSDLTVRKQISKASIHLLVAHQRDSHSEMPEFDGKYGNRVTWSRPL